MSYIESKEFMKELIGKLKPGTEFTYRDIMGETLTRLGRTLYEGVQDGSIPDVECLGVQDGVDKYRKK